MDGHRKKAWWTRGTNNWNQVCSGGVTIGALAVVDEVPEPARELIGRCAASIQIPMRQYAPDGGCEEGPGYWHYATQYNVYFLAARETALGPDSIDKFLKFPGFDQTGFFRINVCSTIGQMFNYADASSRTGATDEMFWLAKKFDQPVFAWHQRQMLKRRGATVHDLIWYDPRGNGPVADKVPLDAIFRRIDVTLFRSAWSDPDAVFLGFKGGDNRASHSHLDLGSFVFDALGKRWALDLGADNYNLPGYFGGKRWTYYRLRTESHNTLLIDERNQDSKARAQMIAFSSKPGIAYAVADMSNANGDRIKRHLRAVALLERTHVLVQDELTASRPVEARWSMLTKAEIKLDGPRAFLSQGDSHVLASIIEPEGAKFETVSANPPRPQRQQPDVTSLVVKLPQKVKSTRLVVLLTPYRGDSPPTYRPRTARLKDWVAEGQIAQ